jgi:hypothetical protein
VGHFRNDFSPSAVPVPDYAKQTSDTLAAQHANAPNVYADTAQFSPKYTELANSNLHQFLFGNGSGGPGLVSDLQDIQPTLNTLQAQGNTAQRQADIADVGNLGTSAVAAYQSANPAQKALVDKLNASANAGLDAGYNLPSGMRRTVTQASRAASADRGLGNGPNAAYNETLANSQAAADFYGQNFNRATQVVGINQATTGDPFQLVTGRSSGASGLQLLGQGQSGAGSANTHATTRLNPPSKYPGDIYGFNANAANASNIMGSQNDAALAAAGISAAGKVGGSL